jgi:hypothetical protein
MALFLQNWLLAAVLAFGVSGLCCWVKSLLDLCSRFEWRVVFGLLFYKNFYS